MVNGENGVNIQVVQELVDAESDSKNENVIIRHPFKVGKIALALIKSHINVLLNLVPASIYSCIPIRGNLNIFLLNSHDILQ